MSRLLAANFLRLKKNICFWGGFLFMIASGILIPAMRYAKMTHSGFHYTLEDGFFNGILFIVIFLSVFCSLFMGTEYSDGTIRNKIIIGHKRTDIYLSNLLTCLFVSLIMCFAHFAAYLCVGIPLFGFFEIDLKVILLFLFTVMILAFAFSAIFTMIAMAISNKALVSVICILSTFLLIFIGSYLNNRLMEPETYSAYIPAENGAVSEAVEEKNPTYLSGKKREVYQFVFDFLPGGQLVQCTMMTAVHPYRLSAYSAVIFAGTTLVGAVLFRRKDIK
ncbi:MAG: ABC transporter permease subunit [Eubacterium sp.]|nr:ABC transporter permease subunit [Eubacterium sp.]